MKIMIQCTLQQFPHQGNLLRGIDNGLGADRVANVVTVHDDHLTQ